MTRSSADLATAVAAPLVFHWREPGVSQHPVRQALLRWLPWLIVLLLLAWIAAILLILVAHTPGGWEQAGPKLWSAAQEKPGKWLALLAQVALFVLIAWAGTRLPGRARLLLTHDALRYQSGLPWLGRWLDWQLDLQAVRAGHIRWQWAGATPMGNNPAATARLLWGTGALRGLRPAAWHVPGQPPPAPPVAHKRWALVRWTSPGNQAVLRQYIEALPLIQALRERAVPVPGFDDRRQGIGLDLMAYARIRAVVLGFFVLLALAAMLRHLMRHTHYFVAPSPWLWGLAGGVAALLALGWMWPDRWPAGGSDWPGHAAPGGAPVSQPWLISASPTAKPAADLTLTQVIVAALFGLAFALLAPLLPLAWASYTSPAKTMDFRLQSQTPPVLAAADATQGVPAIRPHQAHEFWASLPPGQTVTLPVRQGAAGLWWQYDSSGLIGRLVAFYDAHPG